MAPGRHPGHRRGCEGLAHNLYVTTDPYVTTVSGHMWHLPGPKDGHTACGSQISEPAPWVQRSDDWPVCKKCHRNAPYAESRAQ